MLAAILRRVRMLLRLGYVVLSNPSKAAQLVQVKVGVDQALHDIEHWEPYGYTARPHADSEVLVAALKGNPSHSIALIIGGRKFRLADLEEGEVALYDDLGNKIILMRDKIHVNAVTHLEAIAPTTELISNVTITGTLHVTDAVTCESTVHAADSILSDTTVEANTAVIGGTVSDSTGSMQGMRDIYNAHGAGAPAHPPGDM